MKRQPAAGYVLYNKTTPLRQCKGVLFMLLTSKFDRQNSIPLFTKSSPTARADVLYCKRHGIDLLIILLQKGNVI